MTPMKTEGYTFLPTSEILSAMASHSASVRADQRDLEMDKDTDTDTDHQTNDDSDADAYADADADRPDRPFLEGPSLRSESLAARRSSEWSTTTTTSSTALLAPSSSASASSSTLLPSTSFDLENASASGLFSFSRSPSARKRRLHKIRTGYFSWPLICGMIAVLVLVYTAIDHFLPDSSLLSLAGGVYTSETSAEQETVYAVQAEGTAPYHVGIGHAGVASSALPGVMPFKGDTTHVLVPITPLPPSPELLGSISTRQPHRVLSTYYLDGTYEAGSPAPQSQLDIVYLWVNSTSRFFQDALEAKAAEEKVGAARGRARRWRDNGELRPAIRSAVQHLGKALRRVHLLTGDYEFPLGEFRDRLPYEDEMEEGVEVLGWRAGQIPTWLDWDRVANAGVSAVAGANGKVAWHPHSEVFRLPRDHGMLDSRLRDDADGGKEEDKWREEAMPSFDSFEIESRVGWISGLSENFVLSNDDMFILSPLSASDFHHPLLGTVVRFEPSPQLLVRPVFTPDLLSTPGEWGGLQHASLLLSRRFPSRPRMYMHHMPKALTRSLVQEASVMFAEDLTKAATRAFRESRRGEGDVEIAWLVAHLGVERWREALLWSWAVARVGGKAGEWGESAREEVRKVLKIKEGKEGEDEDEVMVVKGKRSTLEDIEAIMKKAGWEMPSKSTYTFSSMDGHLPPRPDINILSTSCSISLSKCFAPDFLSSSTPYPAQEIFRNITFVYPECGDCLIDALVTASGTRGLSAFLPRETDVFYPEQRDPAEWERSEPMLPLTSTWEGVDFSLDRVVRPGQDMWDGVQPAQDSAVRLREWCMKLLSRYAYTFAITPSHFAMVRTYRQLENTLASFDSRKDLVMVCINDDQPDHAGEENRRVYKEWTERRWGNVQATWEREWGMKRFKGKRGRRSIERRSEQKEG